MEKKEKREKGSLVYMVDITLRRDDEEMRDFIERAKRDNLGNWIDKSRRNNK